MIDLQTATLFLNLRPFEVYEEYAQIYCNALALGAFKAATTAEKAVEDAMRRSFSNEYLVRRCVSTLLYPFPL